MRTQHGASSPRARAQPPSLLTQRYKQRFFSVGDSCHLPPHLQRHTLSSIGRLAGPASAPMHMPTQGRAMNALPLRRQTPLIHHTR
jgi:hypothetical protein